MRGQLIRGCRPNLPIVPEGSAFVTGGRPFLLMDSRKTARIREAIPLTELWVGFALQAGATGCVHKSGYSHHWLDRSKINGLACRVFQVRKSRRGGALPSQ